MNRNNDITEQTKVRLTLGQIGAIITAILAAAAVLVSFTVWLQTMHEDVQTLKRDAADTKATVQELSRWLMPDHPIPPSKQAKLP